MGLNLIVSVIVIRKDTKLTESIVTSIEISKKTPETLETIVSLFLKSIDAINHSNPNADMLVSLRLLIPQYKRLLKYFNNHFDSRISFLHLATNDSGSTNGNSDNTNSTSNFISGNSSDGTRGSSSANSGRPKSANPPHSQKRKKPSSNNINSLSLSSSSSTLAATAASQSIIQKSLRIPFFEIAGDLTAQTLFYKVDSSSGGNFKSQTNGIENPGHSNGLTGAPRVNRHVDLHGPVYGAYDLSNRHSPDHLTPTSSASSTNSSLSQAPRFLSPIPQRPFSGANSPLLMLHSNHNNNSGLTLHKVNAIQIALDDNKSPTFPEILDKRRGRRTIRGFDRGGYSRTGGHAREHSLVKYGWVILGSTWLIVLLGISSMLNLFDLDVVLLKLFGFTASANDIISCNITTTRGYSLEKQIGYPIPGYYSCLIFLTFVVAWVWCVSSWMGMKFFRHAKGGLTKGTVAGTGSGVSAN